MATCPGCTSKGGDGTSHRDSHAQARWDVCARFLCFQNTALGLSVHPHSHSHLHTARVWPIYMSRAGRRGRGARAPGALRRHMASTSCVCHVAVPAGAALQRAGGARICLHHPILTKPVGGSEPSAAQSLKMRLRPIHAGDVVVSKQPGRESRRVVLAPGPPWDAHLTEGSPRHTVLAFEKL